MLQLTLLCFLFMLHVTIASAGSEVVSTLEDQQSVSVTIYNQDLALVRDAREVTLPSGQQTLAFREVSAKIRPQTALLAAPSLRVLE